MVNRLCDLPESSEFCSLSDWQDVPIESRVKMHISEMNFVDPLRDCIIPGILPIAVFGYSATKDIHFHELTKSEENINLVYFWYQNLQDLKIYKGHPLKKEISIASNLLKFGSLIGKLYKNKPLIQDIINSNGEASPLGGFNFKEIFSIESDQETQIIRSYWHEKAIFSVFPGKGSVVFFCIFKYDILSPDKGNFDSSAGDHLISLHLDYFLQKSAVLNSIPMTFISFHAKYNKKLFKLLVEPKLFSPFNSSSEFGFQWPWQRCVFMDPIQHRSHKFSHSTIRTISLFMDIRKSTIALDHLPTDEMNHFIEFINRIEILFKKIIFECGGFFDKEVGDGFLAHFAESIDQDFSIPEQSSKRSLLCGIRIICQTQSIIEEFGRKLRHGINELGISVGIHVDNACWIVEKNKIKVLGHSVIDASRLCSEAKKDELFLSNKFYNVIEDNISTKYLKKFSKKKYKGKEEKNATFYGYKIKINKNNSSKLEKEIFK
ncbi:MAG: adenylate/guanylate cyclase domain-containing protein [Rhodospirillaceae bacterium]